MFCKVSRFLAKPENLDEIARTFKIQYIPIVSHQPGFKETYLLTSPGGKFMIINIWDSKEQSDEWFKNVEYQNIIFLLRPLLKSAESPEDYKIAERSETGIG